MADALREAVVPMRCPTCDTLTQNSFRVPAASQDGERLEWLQENGAHVEPLFTMDDDERDAWDVRLFDGSQHWR